MEGFREAFSADFDYARSRKSALLLRFSGHSGIYAALGLLIRLGNFVLLPIYWRRLTPSDFGILAISELVSFGLAGVMTLCLETAITRSYPEWSDEDRPRNLGAIWGVGSLGSVLLAAAAYLCGAAFWDQGVRHVAFSPYIQLALAAALFRSFSNIPFALLRAKESLHAFSLMQLVSFVLSSAGGLYFVFGAGWGASGVLLGTALGQGVTALVWVGFMSRQTKPFEWRRHVPQNLSFTLPLIPAVILGLAASLCDRYFLDRFVSLAEIGLYAIGVRFAGIVKEFNNFMKNAWVPFATRLAVERPDGRQMIGALSKYYFAGVLVATLGVGLLAGEFISWFDPGLYRGAVAFIPVLVLAAFLDVFDVMAAVGFLIRRMTPMILTLAAFEGGVTLVLVGALTWKWGAEGTMWAVLASRSLTVLLRFRISSRALAAGYPCGVFAMMGGMALITYALGSLVWKAPVWASAGVKIGLLVVFTLTSAWLFLDLRQGWALMRDRFGRTGGGGAGVPPGEGGAK